MNTQHTPGPWRVIAHGGARYQVEEHTETVSFSLVSDYSEANARLIAAAPDLLEALKRLAGMAKTFPDELHKDHPDVLDALAAIAKATGETT